jgi:hypothetical protein
LRSASRTFDNSVEYERVVPAPDKPVVAHLGHREVELAGVRIRTAELDEDVGSRSGGPHAELPIAAGVAADERHLKEPPGQQRHVRRRRLAREIPAAGPPRIPPDVQPGVDV